ncbi:hypothetical protein QUB25_04145 [Microcoleus sp. B3-D7]
MVVVWATPLPIWRSRSISLISKARLAVFNRRVATREPLKPAPTIARSLLEYQKSSVLSEPYQHQIEEFGLSVFEVVTVIH